MVDVLKNIENKVYETKILLPNPPRRVCECGAYFRKFDRFCSQCGNNVYEFYKHKTAEYLRQREIYHKDEGNKQKIFENDLYKEFQVTDNPKRFDCFSLAWEYGHSYGLKSVYEYFYDLVDLIK